MTITDTRPQAGALVQGRTLIPEQDFAVVAARIAAEGGMDLAVAESCLDQAIAFVAASARLRRRLGPSKQVDTAWHQLIGYTRVYQRLADNLGVFVHHVPQDSPDYIALDTAETGTDVLVASANAIEEAGFVVDPRRWGRVFAASRGVALEDADLNAAGDSSPDCLSDWSPDCLTAPDK